MDLQAFKQKYQALPRGEFDILVKNDKEFLNEVQELYKLYFGALNKSCGNCLHDAYIQLMTMKQNKVMETKKGELKFEVKAGTFVYDPVSLDSSQILTPASLFNIGNDLALRHIIHAKMDINKYFSVKPSEKQLKYMIAEYKSRVEGDSTELDAIKSAAKTKQDAEKKSKEAKAKKNAKVKADQEAKVKADKPEEEAK